MKATDQRPTRLPAMRRDPRWALTELSLVMIIAGLSACVAPTGSAQASGQLSDATHSDTALADAAQSTDDAAATAQPTVVIETNMGVIVVSLDASAAPISVANFLGYVDKSFYDGLLFHRVIANFMIQGGGFTAQNQAKKPDGPIKNEATNGRKNLRGTVAMARTSVVDSATSQFFINHKDNAFLDHKDTSSAGYGYAVFGAVVSGLDVVDKIAAVKTSGSKANPADKPLSDVVILSIRRQP